MSSWKLNIEILCSKIEGSSPGNVLPLFDITECKAVECFLLSR